MDIPSFEKPVRKVETEYPVDCYVRVLSVDEYAPIESIRISDDNSFTLMREVAIHALCDANGVRLIDEHGEDAVREKAKDWPVKFVRDVVEAFYSLNFPDIAREAAGESQGN